MTAVALPPALTFGREAVRTSESAALMGRVAQGDAFAFEELYDRYAGRVLAVVRSVLRDPAQSEEVTQEVLVEAWATAARFDSDRGRVDTWLLTMARRRAIDRVRSEQAARNRHDRVGQRSHVRPVDEVSEVVIVDDEHATVRAAMNCLTDLQRQAVTLAFFDGMTHREVAKILEAPLGTVKTRIRDGLIRLREALATD